MSEKCSIIKIYDFLLKRRLPLTLLLTLNVPHYLILHRIIKEMCVNIVRCGYSNNSALRIMKKGRFFSLFTDIMCQKSA